LNLFIFPWLSALSQVFLVGIVVYFRKRLTHELRVLAVYLILSLLSLTGQIYLALNHINNYWLLYLFSPIEFGLLMYVFYLWNRNSFVGKMMLYSIPLYIGGWGLGILLSGSASNTFTYMSPISAAGLVLVSSYTLLSIERAEGSPVLGNPSFWISSATLIYFGSTIVFSSLNTSIQKASIGTMQIAFSVQAVINILANLVYAGGFLCLRRKT